MLFEETGLSADGKAVCKVFALYAGRQITLFETSPVILNGEIDRGRTVPHTLFAQFDAVSLLDAVYVEPERRVSQPNDPSTYLDTQGRVKLVPVDKFRIGEFIGVNFETDHSLAIGIAIESNGKPYFRYYPKTPVGKNVLVLVSPVGFDGGENIKDVDSVTLFIYTDKQLERSYIKDINLVSFNNTAELQRYFAEKNPLFYSE